MLLLQIVDAGDGTLEVGQSPALGLQPWQLGGVELRHIDGGGSTVRILRVSSESFWALALPASSTQTTDDSTTGTTSTDGTTTETTGHGPPTTETTTD